MIFIVISQKAIPNANFKVNDLPAHGRFDIVVRCILSASRQILGQKGTPIYCFLKGAENHGWISWPISECIGLQDEISIACRIKENWDNLFTTGSLLDLIKSIEFEDMILLDENGQNFEDISADLNNCLVVLGAQKDLNQGDLYTLEPNYHLKLGKDAMLASHAITFFRQVVLTSEV
ncbi:MAG: hypothetical protein ACXAD7_12310 [Candidatus Kariarchaeaceae archaeon]|jgi:tRNA pseudouridine-54 N-methylase